MSPTDDRDELERKMQEYRVCGVSLGWLIDPDAQEVLIYRATQADPEVLQNPKTLSGEETLPGLSVNLAGILED